MTTTDDGITYVDHEPSLSMMARYGVPAWATEQRHVHLRGSDRCLKRDGGELCGQTDDDTLARRLEWATGYQGHRLLRELRAEGLDVIATKPEQGEQPEPAPGPPTYGYTVCKPHGIAECPWCHPNGMPS